MKTEFALGTAVKKRAKKQLRYIPAVHMMGNLLFSLSLLVMTLNVFCVSCSTIPCVPTYEGHLDFRTGSKERAEWMKELLTVTCN